MPKQKQPDGPPITLNTLRGGAPLPTTPAPDENDDRQAESCLAKAAYCKWAASVTTGPQFKEYYAHLSAQWQKEADKWKEQSRRKPDRQAVELSLLPARCLLVTVVFQSGHRASDFQPGRGPYFFLRHA
jgi:hypothetical protein